MNGKECEKTNKIDEAICRRILQAGERDDQGFPLAAIPASDKFGLAKQTGVELEDIARRLDVVAEEVMQDDPQAVAPRYRLRDASGETHAGN